jgi:hypothetical protein
VVLLAFCIENRGYSSDSAPAAEVVALRRCWLMDGLAAPLSCVKINPA